MQFSHALVRQSSPKYAAFYAPRGIEISIQLAHQQHDAYIAALKSAGVEVTILPPHPTHHDCVFIEDTAIVWRDSALITRMNDVRNGEQQDVEQWLSSRFKIFCPPSDARIEGGDVLHLDEITLVGRSTRTNEAGIEALRQFMEPMGHEVLALDVNRCLHLKSAITYLGDQTVLVAPQWIDIDLPKYHRIDIPPAESHAANALRVNRHLLYAAGCPRTAKLLTDFFAQHDVKPVELHIGEFQKADGALTCQSLLW